jgi:hypothetical protein
MLVAAQNIKTHDALRAEKDARQSKIQRDF